MQKALQLLLLGILFSTILKGNNDYLTSIQHLSTEDGLLHNDLHTLHIDHRGYVWIGTKYGLNYYDGYHFKWFTKEKNQLASNQVQRIVEDQEAWLWVFEAEEWLNGLNFRHLSFVHTITHEVQSPAERFDHFPLEVEQIYSIIQDANNVLWLGMEDGSLIRYEQNEGFKKIRGETNNSIWLHMKKSNGHLLASYIEQDNIDKRELVLIDTNNKQIHSLLKSRNLNPIESKEDSLWVASVHGTNKKSSSSMTYITQNRPHHTQELHHILKKEQPVKNDWLSKTYYSNASNTFWYASTKSLYVFHPQQGLLYDFGHQHPEIIKDQIHDIIFDQQGLAYIATSNGMYLVTFNKSPFKRWFFQSIESTPTGEFYSCRKIVAHEDYIYVNTNKKRHKIQKNTGETKSLQLFSNHIAEDAEYDFVLDAYVDQENQLWFSERLLVRHDPKQDTDDSFTWENSKINPNIWSIFQDQYGKIWLGLENGGLAYFDHQKNKIVEFKDSTIAQYTPYHFHEIAKDTILIASDGGLFFLNPKLGIWKHLHSKESASNFIPNDLIYHIHQDREGNFYLASGGGGLIYLPSNFGSNESFEYQQFTIADGLSDNTLYAVYEDGNDQLWLSSNKGIIQFDKTSYHSRAYLPVDGTSHHEYNRLSHFQDQDGQLYFGSLNGVTSFHPDHLATLGNSQGDMVNISRLQRFHNKEKKWKDETITVLESGVITLSKQYPSFDLQLSMKDYFHAQDNRFQYRIPVLDERWSYLESNRLRLWQLPFGKHQLELRGQKANGQFTSKPLVVLVEHFRPFYYTSWFWLAVLAALISGSILYYRYRVRLLQEQNMLLERKVSERTRTIVSQKQELEQLNYTKDRLFSIIGHDLRKPILSFRGIAKKINFLLKKEDYKRLMLFGAQIEENALALNKLTDNLLNWALIQKSGIPHRLECIELSSVIEEILEIFQHTAEEKQLFIQIDVPKEAYIFAGRNAVHTILRNILDNAIKYNLPSGTIVLSTQIQEKYVQLNIRDQGIGISQEQQKHLFELSPDKSKKGTSGEKGTGLGLHLVKELLQLNQGKIEVESQVGKGSTFKLFFPKNNYSTLDT